VSNLVLLTACGLFPWSALPPGGLDPNHVALVFNKKSRASGELALFYADRRGVPKRQMIALDLPLKEDLPRVEYESKVAEPIRDWLMARGLVDRIVCLAVFYDVPIRVGPQTVTPEMRRALSKARRQQKRTLQAYARLLAEVNGVARPTTRPTTTTTATRPVKRAADVRKEFLTALALAKDRASRLRDPVADRAANRRLLTYMERAEGVSGVLRHIRKPDRRGTELGQKQLEKLRQAVREGQARINELLRAGPLAPERDQARELIGRFAGLIGLLAHLEQDIERLRGKHTTASLDSELSTPWAPRAGPYRWRINTLNARVRASGAMRAAVAPAEWAAPVMMVARLDGPSPTLVRRMIEDAISTEKVGLKGHAYFDARGLDASRVPGSYELYDQNVRDLALLSRTKTSMPTVLDNYEDLFGLGMCPDAALYCGWYRVGRYRDAFDFVRGAVGFHIASSEAVSLRDRKNRKQRYWCKELLKDGVAATLGPVAEPFLSAFPKPRDFFGLLMTGQYTLVECFYYTNPYNSWMMMLIGDPLYRPFKLNPQLKVQDVLPGDVLPLQPIPTSQPTATRPVQPRLRADDPSAPRP